MIFYKAVIDVHTLLRKKKHTLHSYAAGENSRLYHCLRLQQIITVITNDSNWNKEYLPKPRDTHHHLQQCIHDLKATGQQPSAESGIISNQRLKTFKDTIIMQLFQIVASVELISTIFYQALKQHWKAFKFSKVVGNICAQQNSLSKDLYILCCMNKTFIHKDSM